MPSEAPPLPPLYHRIVALDQAAHGDLRLDPDAGYGFARETNAVPLALGEFAVAAQHYPIVFSVGPRPMPVAVVGYRNSENLFIARDGTWEPGRYVPAYLRAFPFVLVQPDPDKDHFIMGVEADWEGLNGTRGKPLLADGAPTPTLQERMTLCTELRAGLLETGCFAEAVKQAGLLQTQEARLDFKGGEVAKLDGFQVLDPAKLAALPDATVLEWHRNGWLPAAYAAVFASNQWARVMDQAAARRLASH